MQGGAVKPLRIESARALADMDFHGLAIGGLAVGEPQEVMLEMLETVVPHLPKRKPRYLMGVGTPDDIVQAVARGVDMFDCVMPTRAGRHGLAYTRFGKINLLNARHAEDAAPLDRGVELRRGAKLFARLSASSVQGGRNFRHDAADQINVAYYQELMAGLREAIAERRLEDFIAETKEGWARGLGEETLREPSSDPAARGAPSPSSGRRSGRVSSFSQL